MSLFSNIKRAIFGYDAFILYSRKDSMDYAYALAEYFIDKKYEIFIDQILITTPGEKIPDDIVKSIKRSKGLILIGSHSAQLSKENDPIPQEVETFLKSNGSRFLVPINVGDVINVDRVKRKEPTATIIEKKFSDLLYTKSPKKTSMIKSLLKRF